MKKLTYLSISLGLCVAVLAGCSLKKEAVKEVESVEPQEIESVVKPAESEKPSEEEPEQVGVTVPIVEVVSPFKEGYAWVRSEDTLYAINKDGVAIYSTPYVESGAIVSYGSSFYDGVAAVAIPNASGGPNRIDIIDTEGKVLYSIEDSENETHTLLLAAKGVYVIKNTVSSFSENGSNLTFIDKAGNEVMSKIELASDDGVFVPFDSSLDTAYMGNIYSGNVNDLQYAEENIFAFMTYYQFPIFFYNADTREVMNFPDSITFMERWVSVASDYQNEESFKAYLDAGNKRIPANINSFASGSSDKESDVRFYNFNSGKAVAVTKDGKASVVDLITGEKLFDCQDYGDDVKYILNISNVGCKVYGDCVQVVLKGADGAYYVTVLDMSGKQLYEPVKIESGNYLEEDLLVLGNGYFYEYTSKKFITKDGKRVDNTGDLSFFGDKVIIDEKNKKTLVSEGFVDLSFFDLTTKGLRSLDGNKVIKEITVIE